MFRNFLITALRTFRRNKVFTLINVAGLAIGISAALVIYLIVQYEFSFDTAWPNKERIYRVVTNMHFPNQDFKNGGVPGPLPAAVRQEIPAVEKSAFLVTNGPGKVIITSANGEEKLFRHQDQIVLADDSYFDLFPYRWIAGNPPGALDAPDKVVLTESRARIYFPTEDPAQTIGRTITYDDSIRAVVTGIVQDRTENTAFTFKEFLSLVTLKSQMEKQNGMGEWGSVSSAWQFFVMLRKGADPDNVNRLLKEVRNKNKQDAYLETDHFLQPLSDMHFNPDFHSLGGRQAHRPTLYGLLAVAAFLLLLGCINFINLTTAQSAQRAREIGIRKTLGSEKRQLILQFLSETMILTTTAAVLSLVLTPLILQMFSGFVPEDLRFDIGSQFHIVLFLLALIVVVTLLAGMYPALVLSNFKPVTVLKNVAHGGTAQSRRLWVRKTLTVSQFVIAQFFIIATVVVGKQIRFAMRTDMGFKKDAIITFSTPFNALQAKGTPAVLYEKLKSIPGISELSLAGPPPASNSTSSTTMKFHPGGKEIETTVEVKDADTAYFRLYHMKLVAGRFLLPSDTIREYLVNETLTRFLGYKHPSDIVGTMLERGDRSYPVVGVLADFHSASVRQAIQPLAYSTRTGTNNTFHIALPPRAGTSGGWTASIGAIGKEFNKIYPEEPFSYTFLDENIAAFYKKEQDTARLLAWSTGLTIFISCLGLLGLVMYSTTQRTKEIGVRKVLGASVTQIVTLLSKDFVRLVLLAFLIAAPLAWWSMHWWLRDYAYRTSINWWIFLACGMAMLLVALLTLSVQTIRSALANPSDALRSE